jgi:hypothetical protein
MFGNHSAVFSIREIKRSYPDQWVAITVMDIDADGFAASGRVIMHDSDESRVWSAAMLGDTDDTVYVFYTGARRTTQAA